MAESEEDLTRFRFEDLLDVVDEAAASLERSGKTKGQAKKLRKVSEELRRRNPETPQQAGASPAPHLAQIGFARRPLGREVPSRTKNLKPPGRRG